MVLDQSYPPARAGLVLTDTDSGRTFFVLPWQNRSLVGTLDQPAELSEHPRAADQDLDDLLRQLRKVLDPPPKKEQVRATWSGLRALIRRSEIDDSALSPHKFVIDTSSSGLLTIAGGKWTSYRLMAEKLVDRVVAENALQAKPCQTKTLSLQGAAGWQPTGWQLLAKHFLLDEPTARYLHASYGTRAPEVAKLAVGELLEPLAEGFACIGAEVVYAVKCELAERAMDVLARRLPLALLDRQAARKASGRVVQLMAFENSWTPDRRLAEQQLVEQRLLDAL
jgi:glycerol-3-phosphate dehydrogenase